MIRWTDEQFREHARNLLVAMPREELANRYRWNRVCLDRKGAEELPRFAIEQEILETVARDRGIQLPGVGW